MCIAPLAVFINNTILDGIAWIMLITLGIFIIITGFVTLQEAKESSNWPKVKANNFKYALKSHSNDGARRYIPAIQCTFYVEGAKYSGTEYDFSSTYTSKEEANEKLNSVRAMDPVFIYYKPSDPAVNVINPGVHSVPYVRIILGFLMVVIPILIWSGVIVLK